MQYLSCRPTKVVLSRAINAEDSFSNELDNSCAFWHFPKKSVTFDGRFLCGYSVINSPGTGKMEKMQGERRHCLQSVKLPVGKRAFSRIDLLAVILVVLVLGVWAGVTHSGVWQANCASDRLAGLALHRLHCLSDLPAFKSLAPQVSCVGSLTHALHLTRGMIAFITGLAPSYLLVCGYGAMPSLWRGRAASLIGAASRGDGLSPPSEVKMSCPGCGIHIKYPVQNLGQRIPCPNCQAMITLRKSDLLETASSYWTQHVEFPPRTPLAKETPAGTAKWRST